MASDRVPGAKSAATGAPVTQSKLSADAAAGASRLAALVNSQRAAAASEKRAVQQEALEQSLWPDPNPSSGLLHLLHSKLDSRIDGQFAAKAAVAKALRRRSFQLDDSARPLRMLFAGPSGVGKTEMAIACCEALLGSCVEDRNFKRFNLSEFSHPSKFNRLTGGDPNYVGYKEGGELTNFIRQAEERRAKRLAQPNHTSCVILFDEVDRAADGLLTFLMNFLDSGQIADGKGDTVDATRAVVLMTTNCAQGLIKQAAQTDEGGAGLDPRRFLAESGGVLVESRGISQVEGSGALPVEWSGASPSELMSAIRREVLRDICEGRYENLGRLGAIVPFTPLCTEGRRGVVERQLRAVGGRLERTHSLSLAWPPALVLQLLAHWDDDLGGRSTRDAIEEGVVEALADELDRSALSSSKAPSGRAAERAGGALELAMLSGGKISCRLLADDVSAEDNADMAAEQEEAMALR